MYTPTFKHVANGLFIGLLGSLMCLSGTAVAQLNDVEPNDTGADAQLLCIPAAGVTLTGTMAAGSAVNLSSDIDIFSFDAAAGDTPNIGVTTDMSWDSLLVLYDENGTLLNQNDDHFDAAGNYTTDSRIDNYALASPGRYFAAVTPVPNYLGDSMVPFAPGIEGMAGGYTLDISGVTASADAASTAVNGSCSPVVSDPPAPEPEPDVEPTGPTTITMEVLHWRGGHHRDVGKRWKHHLKRMGKREGIYPIPVAMLSNGSFDATTIDPSTLTFGVYGDEESLFRCGKRGRDVNKDGMKDMVCFFDAFKTGFDVGDVQGLLNGQTVGGEEFTSSATLKVFKISRDRKAKHDKKHRGKHKHKRKHKHDKHANYKHR
ncbi:MAG: hypothetical protein PVH05_14230 [Burkholderiales bacterium]|jgi:hypothetical protein